MSQKKNFWIKCVLVKYSQVGTKSEFQHQTKSPKLGLLFQSASAVCHGCFFVFVQGRIGYNRGSRILLPPHFFLLQYLICLACKRQEENRGPRDTTDRPIPMSLGLGCFLPVVQVRFEQKKDKTEMGFCVPQRWWWRLLFWGLTGALDFRLAGLLTLNSRRIFKRCTYYGFEIFALWQKGAFGSEAREDM